MCLGFSGFLHKSGKIFFTLPDNNLNTRHHDVLRNIPKEYANDDELLAFEFMDWTEESFLWNMPDSMLPYWADDVACKNKLREVLPAVLKYKSKVEAASLMFARADWYEAIDMLDQSRLDMHNQLSLIEGYCPGIEYAEEVV